MTIMNPEIKTLWVDALRSGKYEQGQGKLRAGNHYCCLGVLCEVYRERQDGEWDDEGKFIARFSASEIQLPTDVMRWSGLRERDPIVARGTKGWSLSAINDDGMPFTTIADLIEAQL